MSEKLTQKNQATRNLKRKVVAKSVQRQHDVWIYLWSKRNIHTKRLTRELPPSSHNTEPKLSATWAGVDTYNCNNKCREESEKGEHAKQQALEYENVQNNSIAPNISFETLRPKMIQKEAGDHKRKVEGLQFLINTTECFWCP